MGAAGWAAQVAAGWVAQVAAGWAAQAAAGWEAAGWGLVEGNDWGSVVDEVGSEGSVWEAGSGTEAQEAEASETEAEGLVEMAA